MAVGRRSLNDREVERVKAIIIGHVRWLRGIDGGRSGNLNHCDLSNWSLANVDMRNIQLMGASLANANLSSSNLSGASLFMADLSGANLQDTNLTNCDLRGVSMRGCNLSGATLTGADLGKGTITHTRPNSPGAAGWATAGQHRSDLSNVVAMNANLSGCDMTGAILRGADLSGADLRRANLAEATLVDVKVDGANFQAAVTFGAEMDPEVQSAVDSAAGFAFDGRKFDIARAIDRHEMFLQTDGARGERLDIQNITISDFSFAGRMLPAMRLLNCKIEGADFSGALLALCDFSGSDLTHANFTDAVLSGANFQSAFLDYANFTRARLDQMPIDGSDKHMPPSFVNASMIDVVFTEATVDGAVFHGTSMTEPTVKSFHSAYTSNIDMKRVLLVRDKDIGRA